MAIETLSEYKKRLKNNQVQTTTSSGGIETLSDFAKRNKVTLDYKGVKNTSGLFKGTEAFKNVGSAFDDGYQFGDITKTLGKGYRAYNKVVSSTAGDLANNIAKGFMTGTEGVADTLQYGVAGALDLIGKDKAASSVREI